MLDNFSIDIIYEIVSNLKLNDYGQMICVSKTMYKYLSDIILIRKHFKVPTSINNVLNYVIQYNKLIWNNGTRHAKTLEKVSHDNKYLFDSLCYLSKNCDSISMEVSLYDWACMHCSIKHYNSSDNYECKCEKVLPTIGLCEKTYNGKSKTIKPFVYMDLTYKKNKLSCYLKQSNKYIDFFGETLMNNEKIRFNIRLHKNKILFYLNTKKMFKIENPNTNLYIYVKKSSANKVSFIYINS